MVVRMWYLLARLILIRLLLSLGSCSANGGGIAFVPASCGLSQSANFTVANPSAASSGTADNGAVCSAVDPAPDGQAPAPPSRESSSATLAELEDLLRTKLSVIVPIDPNSAACWEAIEINEYSKATLLAYAEAIRDPFTRTPEDPYGQFTEIAYHVPVPTFVTGRKYTTFRELIIDHVHNSSIKEVRLPATLVAIYQLTWVKMNVSVKGQSLGEAVTILAERVLIASEPSFWKAVELSAAAGSPVSARAPLLPVTRYKDAPSLETLKYMANTYPLPSLHGSVVVLPRLAARVVHNSVYIPYTSERLSPCNWTRAEMMGMVSTFLQVSKAASIPSVEEWGHLPDKISLDEAYKTYLEKHLDTRTHTIPTAVVTLPLSRDRQLQLGEERFFKLNQTHTDKETHDALAALLAGVIELQDTLDKKSVAVRSLQVVLELEGANSDEPEVIKHYVLKRVMSECAFHVKFFSLPAKAVEELSQYDQLPDLFEWSKVHGHDLGGMLKIAQEMLYQSHAKSWLLQPEIKNMTDLEYRVYLLSGAASEGTEEDTVVVYTPAQLQKNEHDDARMVILMYDWPLAKDYIEMAAQDYIAGTAYQAYANCAQYCVWHDPATYGLIVQAALDGARAIATSPKFGHTMRLARHLPIRIDVVLGLARQGESLYFIPMINEMDWFNSMGTYLPMWSTPGSIRRHYAIYNKGSHPEVIAYGRSSGTLVASNVMEEAVRVLAQNAGFPDGALELHLVVDAPQVPSSTQAAAAA